MDKQRKPAWLVLDLGLLLLIGLLAASVRWPPPTPWRQIFQSGWVGLTYGFITIWMGANAEALERQSKGANANDEPLKVTIYKLETLERDTPAEDNEPQIIHATSAKEVWQETRQHHVNLN